MLYWVQATLNICTYSRLTKVSPGFRILTQTNMQTFVLEIEPLDEPALEDDSDTDL